MNNARGAILEILAQNNTYWDGHFKKPFHNLSQKDKNLATEIVNGIQRHKLTLEYIIEKYSNTSPSKKISDCLKLGLYQLLYLEKIPEYAIIHETVECAKSISPKSAKYVNAILRNVQRQAKRKLSQHSSSYLPITEERGWEFPPNTFPDPEKNTIKYMSTIYSFPEIIVKRWNENFGEKVCLELLKIGNTRAPITIRLRKNTIGPWELINDDMALLQQKGNIKEITGHENGEWLVQGMTSSETIKLIDIAENSLILDMCAAPGGKSFHLADNMKNSGIILACDRSTHRLQRLNENKARLNIATVYPITIDAKNLPKACNNKFDCVLIDVPCTNSAVFNKRAEARWRFTLENLQKLCNEQKKLLVSGAKAVKQGGILVYSTCSIEPEENEHLIADFLKENTTFKLHKYKQMLPSLPFTDGGTVHILKHL